MKASAEDEARKAPQVNYPDKLDTAEKRRNTALTLAGVGGAFVVTGAVLLVLDLTSPTPPVTVGVGPNGAVVMGQGTF
jgi:hypothetical protein